MLAPQSQDDSFIGRHKLLVANVAVAMLLFFAMRTDYFAAPQAMKKPQHSYTTATPIHIKPQYVPSPPKFTISMAKVRSELTDIGAASSTAHIPYDVYATDSSPDTKATPKIDMNKLSASVSRAVVDELNTRKLAHDDGDNIDHAMEPIYAGHDAGILKHADKDTIHILEPHILEDNVLTNEDEDINAASTEGDIMETKIHGIYGIHKTRERVVSDASSDDVEDIDTHIYEEVSPGRVSEEDYKLRDAREAAAKVLHNIVVKDEIDDSTEGEFTKIVGEVSKEHAIPHKSVHTMLEHSLCLRNIIEDPHIIVNDETVIDAIANVIYSMDTSIMNANITPLAKQVLMRLMNAAVGITALNITDADITKNAKLNICTDKLRVFCRGPTEAGVTFVRTILAHDDDMYETQTDKHHIFVLSRDGAYNSWYAHKSASVILRSVERESAAMSYANALLNTSQKVATILAKCMADNIQKGITTTSLMIELDKVILTQDRAAKLLGIRAVHPKYTVVADIVCLYIAVITGAIHGIKYTESNTHTDHKVNVHLRFRDATYNIHDVIHHDLLATAMKAIKIFTKAE